MKPTPMTQLHGRNLIGGERRDGGNGVLQAEAPTNDESLPESFSVASPSDVDEAIQRAAVAADQLREKRAEDIAAFLDTIADRIEALGDTLYARVRRETALPEKRVKGETARTTNQLRLFAEVAREGSWVDARIDRAQPDREPAPKPDLRRMLVPIGPIAVFGASNFPMAFSTAGGDTASAFAAGNPVIVKAHPSHPGTCELVGEAIVEAASQTEMPEGVFSLLHGEAELGQALVTHPKLAAVGFTGSAKAGRALVDAAAARPSPIPVHAEMGSVNPVVVMPKRAEREASTIGQTLAGSITLGTGQFCTKPGLIFAMDDEATDALRDAIAGQLRECRGTMLSSAIYSAYANGLDQYEQDPSVTRVAGSDTAQGTNDTAAALFEVQAEQFLANPALAEENFGPSSVLVRCASRNQLQRALASLPGQLTGTLYAEQADEATSEATMLQDKVGRLLFGGAPTGVEVTHAMQHGGPWPATSDGRSTSVGTAAIYRFARPVCYQNAPRWMLPSELQDDNPRGVLRMVDGKYTREACS